MKNKLRLVISGIITLCTLSAAQPVFNGGEIFPPEEFAARRARIMALIGDGVAILQATTERPGEQAMRQNNQFFYLSGVADPWSILVIDGRSKQSTLLLEPRNERREFRNGIPRLYPSSEAAKATGIEAILDRAEFAPLMEEIGAERRTIHTPFRPEVLGEASASDPLKLWKMIKADPWDGRVSREEAFIAKLKAAAPRLEIKDLDPLIDEMRVIKSPREIELIREATWISGLAIMEVMRDAQHGQFEYELQAAADYIFKKYGAYGPSYFALIATGRNTYYTHYHKNTAVLQEDDLVQIDYAPDYKYYQSDITRVFPADGKFSPWQREYYTISLKLYQALLTSIKAHAAPRDIIKVAVAKMDKVLASFRFTDPKIEEAAAAYIERFRTSKRNSLGHMVGMAVHDVRGKPREILEPGMVFTIEPALRLEDEHLGVRLEDILLVTENGIENLSQFVPIEIDDIEKLMAQPGVSEAILKLPAEAARSLRR